MKSRGKAALEALLIIVGVAVFCHAFLFFMDYWMNGTVVGWLSRSSWHHIKILLIIAFTVTIYLFVLCSVLPAKLYARYKCKKDITFIANAISSAMDDGSEDLSGKGPALSKEYSEIETQILKIKAVAMKHRQMAMTETQRKNDLITYLAHDLKTPLASVIGYLSLLNEAPDLAVRQRTKYVGIALNKAYRLEELIDEFFDITRFNLQSMPLDIRKINLTLMLQQMADEFYPILSPEGRKVAVCSPEGLSVMGDADKLARVFNNILKNAAAYSYAGSTIDIKAQEKGNSVVISFIDRGDPIPARQLNTIFQKFYRLDSSRSSNTGGAGLGLAIAKDIVEAHNGSIFAESGQMFTTFTVVLPAFEAPPDSFSGQGTGGGAAGNIVRKT